jgi:hypothetical protein
MYGIQISYLPSDLINIKVSAEPKDDVEDLDTESFKIFSSR